MNMTKQLVRVEHRTWDPTSGTFVSTGDMVETSAPELERIVRDKTYAGQFLRGPVPQ